MPLRKSAVFDHAAVAFRAHTVTATSDVTGQTLAAKPQTYAQATASACTVGHIYYISDGQKYWSNVAYGGSGGSLSTPSSSGQAGGFYGCVTDTSAAPVRPCSAARARTPGLFPYDIAVPFMAGQDKAWIQLHNRAVEKGQSTLALKGLPKLECADAIGRSLAVAERIHDALREAKHRELQAQSEKCCGDTHLSRGRVQDEKIEQEKDNFCSNGAVT